MSYPIAEPLAVRGRTSLVDTTEPRTRQSRLTITLLLSLLGALGVVLGTAGPALAHAGLQQTTPAPGAAIGQPPRQVTLTFDEGVSIQPDAVQVYDGRGRLVDDGPTTQPAGHDEVVVQRLGTGLADGTYTVTWRVTSDDSHVESSSYTFHLAGPGEARPARSAPPAAAVPTRTDDRLAGQLVGVSRGLSYAGICLGLGSLLVTLLLWPEGLARRATRLTVVTGLVALVVATVAAMLLQQVDARGASLGALGSGPVHQAAVSGRFGHVMLLRLGATVAAAACSWRLLRGPAGAPGGSRRGALGALVVSGLALVVSYPLVGHAATGSRVPLSLAMTSVHVAAMVVWLGGLALLLPLLLRRQVGALSTLLPRFSRVAFGCVVAIVVSGLFQSWREVGSIGALTTTAYGRILLAKVALVAVLVGLGGLARRWVQRQQRLPSGAGPVTPSRLTSLRRGLTAEVGIAVLVLVATAVLTGSARANVTQVPGHVAAEHAPAAAP